MPSKTLGQKQFFASTKKVKEKDACAANNPRQSQRGKDKDAVASTTKDPEAVPRCSFESPSKRKPPITRETSPSKAIKSTDEPQPEFACDGVCDTYACGGKFGNSTPGKHYDNPMIFINYTYKCKTPATKTALENKVGDSDYDEDEDEDEDEDDDEDEDEDDVEEDILPPAQNAAGKAKNPRGRQKKSVPAQVNLNFTLTYTALPLNHPRPNSLGNRALKSPLAACSPGGAGGGGAGGTPTTPGPAGGTPPAQLTPQEEREHSLVLISRVIHATHDMAPAPAGQSTPTPFMYLDSIAPDAVYSEKSVATALIKRSVVVFMSPLFFIFGAFWFLF
jgi:hypothetical protein